jgi:hypothetical protein
MNIMPALDAIHVLVCRVAVNNQYIDFPTFAQQGVGLQPAGRLGAKKVKWEKNQPIHPEVKNLRSDFLTIQPSQGCPREKTVSHLISFTTRHNYSENQEM